MGRAMQRRWVLTLAIILVLGASPGHGKTKMAIHSIHIETKVMSRFARTFITTEVQNPSNSPQEAIFDIELPKTAFIANFNMTVDNVTTVGTVKEKGEAKMTYQRAASRGQSAGLVQATGRKMEQFKISVTIGAQASATFKLTYEELLKRKLGNYELSIRVRPQGLVQNFQINVDIIEPQGISFLQAVGTFSSNDLMDIVNVNRTDTKAHIEFKPSVNQQRACPNCTETLLDGELMVKYDVKREQSAGKIQVINGYFVHYFAPPSLQRIPKKVVFVIDRSGSMYGNKMKQTYEAFLKILGDVPKEDYFAILTFDDQVEKWMKELVQALPENIKKAKAFVSQITARGATNINDALLAAVEMLTNTIFNEPLPSVSASIIIFLSDGEPTSGITNHGQIVNNVKKSLEGRASLYCLGFGNDVDYDFLEKLALQNGGLARRIYEDSDSALQLQGFYNEVAFPMLLDVHLQYLDNSVVYLTQNNFKLYYQGSEIIVAGFISNNSLEVLAVEVTAQGVSTPFSVKLEKNIKEDEEVEKEQHYIFGAFTERLWAYLTIEQLMSRQLSLDETEKQTVLDKVLSLSLKYNFVTPLTSMVVTKPDEEDPSKKLVANKPKEDNTDVESYHDVGEYADAIEYDGILKTASAIVSEEDYAYALSHFAPIQENPAKLIRDYAYALSHFAPIQENPAKLIRDFQHVAPTFVSRRVTLKTAPTIIPSKDFGHDAPTIVPIKDCDVFHVLLREPKASERICIQISQPNDVNITLFHDASTGVTLNGRLGGPGRFGRFGFLNSKFGLRVEIREDKVAIMQGSNVTTYDWNSPVELDGFLKKDGDKIMVTIKDGVSFTVFRVDQSFRLSLSVEDQHSPTDHTSGVIGQLLNNKISFHSSNFKADSEVFPLRRITDCDLTSYGLEDRGSCLFMSLQTEDLISALSYIVLDIFAAA